MNTDSNCAGKLVEQQIASLNGGMVKYHKVRYVLSAIVGCGEIRMAKQPTDYEIPAEMRDFAEKSVDQAKKAFDGFMTAAYKAAGTMEGSTAIVHTGAKDIGRKALTYAEQNVAAALDFAGRLVNAKDPQEVLQLQSEFIRAQLQTFAEQAKDIGATASRVASGFSKNGE
jgi:phasin